MMPSGRNAGVNGFTLIEIMIVVVIIGILSAIALPAYNTYVVQSRRTEGISFLLQVMQQQERFFTERLTYTSDLSELGYTVDGSGAASSEQGFYLVTAAVCPSSTISQCIVLTAQPQDIQAADGDLTLDSRGNRTPESVWQ